MKKIFLTVVYGTMSMLVFAQQDPMYTQYMFNMGALNPAYAGSNEVINATGLFRKQWVGINGSPTTGTFAIDSPVLNDKGGVGMVVLIDKIGKTQSFDVMAQYAYRIKTSEKGRFSIGLQAGISQYSFRGADVSYTSSPSGNSDPTYGENIVRTLPNVGMGFWFNEERFYMGASVPRLINHDFVSNTQGLPIDQQGKARQYRHFFLTTGYIFDLNIDWKLKPSVLFRAVGAAPLAFDLNTNFWFQEKVGFGLSYRSASSVSALLEVHATNQLRLGYSYDLAANGIRRSTSGSHEIMIRYQFHKSEKEPKTVISPRLF